MGGRRQFGTLVERVLLHDVRIDLGRTQGSELNGSRRPTGESPGARNSFPRRRGQRPDTQPVRAAGAFQRWIGSTKPVGSKGAFEIADDAARCSGSSILGSEGSTLIGSAASRVFGAAGLHRRG